MSRHSTCSDARLLQQFVLGSLPADDVESLAQHVADCPECVATLHGLKVDDTLTSAVQQAAQSTQADAADAMQSQMIEQLAERMSRLAISSPAISRSAAGPADDFSSLTLHLDEEARRRFEADWRAARPAAIESYLPAEDVPHYLATLEELIHIDMEFRWKSWSDSTNKAARPLRVENYLDRFPGLNVPDIVRRLVEQEFRLRRYEDEATPEEYQERFPGLELFGIETMQDMRGFLAPAKQPGELGRLGDYRVLRVLGAGGMGIVYQAEDLHLQRSVVLKVMKPELASQPEARQRFLREARAIASFNHDHIVAVFQVGEDRGVPFLTMPLLNGETLDALLKRERRLNIDMTVQIGREIALGLTAAHGRGIIHRDIKPANIWLEKKDEGGRKKDEGKTAVSSSFILHPSSLFRVKIMDFGLARPVETDARLTQSGMIVGSPAYMAPEQARGESVDARADLFSLGCLLYRACTGRLPFEAKDAMSTLLAVAMDSPASPAQLRPETPSALSDLIMKLLAKTAADRPAAAEVADALQALRSAALGATDPAEATTKALAVRVPRAGVAAKKPRQRLLAAAVVSFALLGGMTLFAPTILRFATNQGELIVEIDDPEVEVAVKNDVLTVRPRGKEREFVIRAGKGTLEVYRPGQKEPTLTREFDLARGGKKVVTVRMVELAQVPPANGQGKVGPPDKENPFLLLRKGGKQIAFATLENAIESLEGDCEIEIHGNGPFFVQNTLVVKDRALTLRAAPGYRPQIQCRMRQQSLFHLDGVRLRVDGCDIRHAEFEHRAVFGGSGPSWEFHNCRLLVNVGTLAPVLSYQGAGLQLSNCLVIQGGEWNHGRWLQAGPGKMEINISNCIMATGGRSLVPAGDDCDWKVNLQNNTFFHTGAILPDLEKLNAKLDVRATGNIFQLNSSNNNTYATPDVTTWKDKVRWDGSYNLYVGTKEGLGQWYDKEGKKRGYGLAGWEEVWGKKEQGSAEARRYFPRWRELEFADSPDKLLAAARSLVGGQAEPRGGKKARIGPDWDAVGPGAGYVKALTDAGKPPAKIRPEPPIDGQPYLVVRGGKVIRAFEHLREAVAFARDGDVVELRTDGPLAGEDLSQTEGPRQMLIRAAPGYTPVIRGFWHYSNLTLSLEGLHFHDGGLQQGLNGQNVRLARVANCTFSGPADPIGNHPLYSSIASPVDRPLEIVNCIIPGRIVPRMAPGSRIVVRNSLVGSFWVAGDSGKTLFDIERSVLWTPLHHLIPRAQFHLDPVRPQGGSAPKIIVRDSLVENGTQFVYNGHNNESPMKNVSYAGQRNVYRMAAQAWCNLTRDGSSPPTSLPRWQDLWNTDADSIALDPQSYDPLQWQLLPGSPGYQQGPAGTNLGADVRRIGTFAPVKAK